MIKIYMITRKNIIQLWEKKEEKDRAAATKKEATHLRREVKKIVKKRTGKATARPSPKNPVTRRSKPYCSTSHFRIRRRVPDNRF